MKFSTIFKTTGKKTHHWSDVTYLKDKENQAVIWRDTTFFHLDSSQQQQNIGHL